MYRVCGGENRSPDYKNKYRLVHFHISFVRGIFKKK